MARPPLLALPAIALVTGLTGLAAVRGASKPPVHAHYAPLVRTAATATKAKVETTPTPTPTPAPAPTPTPAPVITAHTLLVGGLTRQWEQLTPGGGTTSTTPILVVLHGQAVTADQEVGRDTLLPLVAQGRAELVYPQGLGLSWNALGCCAYAQAHNIDDVGFIEALVAAVDPGRARPVDLVGYSNGGRLAYTIACQDPTLVDAYAIVDAMPLANGCTLSRPISILQIDGTVDPVIPYRPGDPGAEQPPATTQVQRLQVLDGCAPVAATTTAGSMVTATYTGCAAGTRLVFATYQGANHDWQAGNATTPSYGQAIWTFLSGGRP
jgi:polyhydroxybutyrate depolymerase